MNILLEELPKSVIIHEKEVPINWGFRTSIKFSEIITDSSLETKEQIIKCGELYYGDIIWSFTKEEAKESIEKMIWFYSAGEYTKNNKKSKPVYSFEQDGGYIYSAFKEQFGINLNQSDMHWWEFKSLFSSINQSTQFGKILSYRSIDTSKIRDKEEREYYKAMKKEFALKDKNSEREEQLLEEINKRLLAGEDISELLKG